VPHICPWWGGYFIDNRLRRLLHDPEKIVGPQPFNRQMAKFNTAAKLTQAR
jgi:hypothetical protein